MDNETATQANMEYAKIRLLIDMHSYLSVNPQSSKEVKETVQKIEQLILEFVNAIKLN